MTDSRVKDELIAEREELPSDAMPMLDHRVEFPATENTASPPLVRQLGKIGAGAVVVYLILIAVLPWQQFVRGNGRVVALDPLDRPQLLEAPLSGRLIESRVVEGQVGLAEVDAVGPGGAGDVGAVADDQGSGRGRVG